jgi:hypothetical protein
LTKTAANVEGRLASESVLDEGAAERRVALPEREPERPGADRDLVPVVVAHGDAERLERLAHGRVAGLVEEADLRRRARVDRERPAPADPAGARAADEGGAGTAKHEGADDPLPGVGGCERHRLR